MRHAVLVHGVFDTPAILTGMSRFLKAKGWQTHAPKLTPSSGRAGLDELAEQLRGYLDERFTDDQKFDLVGYSMGGLVCRYFVQRLDGLRRVNRFVTVSTPHNGSYSAYLLRNRGGKQMRPGSDFIADLNRDVEVLSAVGLVSVWTRWDLSILPSSSSRLPVGDMVRLSVPTHPLMVWSRASLREVGRALENGRGSPS